MAEFKEDPKTPVPLWLVSFGDMMTNALTFFILMVSMSHQRDYGLIAKGLGSFVVALKSHGLPGLMPESEKVAIFEEFRQRFNLPPEDDAERRETPLKASELELVRSAAAKALQPHDELFQPSIASFATASAVLDNASKDYIDRLADTLRPSRAQLLVLEGHALDADSVKWLGHDHWLAFARAQAVREHLIQVHGFPAERVEARAWMVEVEPEGPGTRCVDARLVTSTRKE
ncbi:MAG: OmpA family protein [Planctomycetes bacterium]|nr:OmpA family protein [Planctomycetota bacterium]